VRRIVRYTGVGALATGVHYAVLVALVEVAGWAPAWASGAGAVVGAQVAYAGNRRWTFDHGGPVFASWWRFQATALAGALVGMIVVGAAVRLGLHYVLAQVLATGLNLMLTFLINRAWTFRRP
jgi:putative flippase GtrA